MPSDPQRNNGGANIWPWTLTVGLLAGFLIGREMGPRAPRAVEDPGSSGKSGDTPKAAGAAGVAKIYAREADFPADWSKAADLTGVAGIDFAGITDAQKATAMQALNERDCECGCGMGHIAACAKKDPNCPRSPKIAKQVVELAKQGKGLTELLAYIDVENPKRSPGAAADAPAPAPGAQKVAIPAHSPRRGPKNAKVTIVEFSDFQCPFCGRVIPTVKEILEKYPKDVALVFVNQPLPFHEHAKDAAKAFMAAHKQNKAWELHDKMFANQQALTASDLEKYARESGINVTKLEKDIADPATEKLIVEDQALASAVGANGTPTFFINGREISGAQPFAAFQTVIDEEIEKANALLKKGTKPEQLYAQLMAAAVAAAPAAAAAVATATPAGPAPKVKIDVGDSPVKGPASAPITLIAFSDFQCPFCSRAVPTMKQVEDSYKDKVRIAFKNMPLPFHDHAQLAAEAALAANEQGRFWDYHDKLFANQQALDRPALEKYAQDLGLDVPKFKAALDSHRFKQRVDDDAKLGASVGATGTPTFFVNGRVLVGAQPFDKFKELIDQELK